MCLTLNSATEWVGPRFQVVVAVCSIVAILFHQLRCVITIIVSTCIVRTDATQKLDASNYKDTKSHRYSWIQKLTMGATDCASFLIMEERSDLRLPHSRRLFALEGFQTAGALIDRRAIPLQPPKCL